MQPQLSAILSEWQHVKWACVWALSRRVAPSWQHTSAHVCKILSCHSAMWVPTGKSPTLHSRPISLGLFCIPSYEKFLRGKRFSSDEVKETATTWFEEQSKDFFFSRGIKSLQQKWAKCIELLGDYLKNKKYFFVIRCFFLTQVDKLLNAPRTFVLPYESRSACLARNASL